MMDGLWMLQEFLSRRRWLMLYRMGEAARDRSMFLPQEMVLAVRTTATLMGIPIVSTVSLLEPLIERVCTLTIPRNALRSWL